jgi:hypothetical protein
MSMLQKTMLVWPNELNWESANQSAMGYHIKTMCACPNGKLAIVFEKE